MGGRTRRHPQSTARIKKQARYSLSWSGNPKRNRVATVHQLK
uniref:Uncharacterized protein n=1 Tax=Arundo donax TaxID=35708 RepID=A0A0A9SHK6_ARUDO